MTVTLHVGLECRPSLASIANPCGHHEQLTACVKAPRPISLAAHTMASRGARHSWWIRDQVLQACSPWLFTFPAGSSWPALPSPGCRDMLNTDNTFDRMDSLPRSSRRSIPSGNLPSLLMMDWWSPKVQSSLPISSENMATVDSRRR